MFERIDFSALVRLHVRTVWGGIVGRPVTIRGKALVQLEYNRDGVISHVNLPAGDVGNTLEESAAECTNAVILTEGRTYESRRTKKGKVLSHSYTNDKKSVPEKNDRTVAGALDPHDPLYAALGLTTADGKVKADKSDKFRQIGRFAETVGDLVKGETCLRIVDYGCGKSYLDFVLEAYLQSRGIEADITGLDIKKDVIAGCEALRQRLGKDNMRFVCADAAAYNLSCADLVVTLHACDTATDYALYAAVRAGVKYIVSVPCCQHEMKANMTGGGLLSDYGIVRDRAAALATDAVRAAVLEAAGYKVQILEYVDDEHSLKNLMLRCVKRRNFTGNAAAADKARQLLKWFGAPQKLFDLLLGDAPSGRVRHAGTGRLETERLVLRRFRPSDAEAVFRNRIFDAEAAPYRTKAYRSADDVRAYLTETEKKYADKAHYEWCVQYKETGEPIGSIAAVSVNDALGSVGLTFGLIRAYRGKGLMTEAARAVVRFLFEAAGFNRIEATHFAGDNESGRVLEKIGMQKEGILRENGADNTGALRDVVVYSVLKSEFLPD